MSRVTAETNVLGSWAYNYVDNGSGTSKGTTRLSSIDYPNSQVTNFSYFGNSGDQRLRQINNLDPSAAMLSRFDYAHNPAGEITLWQQQQNGNSEFHNLQYDLAGQLSADMVGSGAPQAPYGKQLFYGYDCGSNRKSVESNSVQTLRKELEGFRELADEYATQKDKEIKKALKGKILVEICHGEEI